MDDLNHRLVKLELLYMEQDDVVQVLNRVVHQQQIQIGQLEKQLQHVAQQIKKTEDEKSAEEVEPLPPHY
ncbi:MAG: SlyX family protein [Cocleimonas sp.]|nr:SlyX family protein [Cocleimonas sp.]